MAKREIYSASLERLPDGFYEWEQDGRNPIREGHWRDFLKGETPDWLRRSKTYYDHSNPPRECYAGEHMDYDFGGTWRFSQEGELPGSDSDSYGPGDSPNSLNILREAVQNDREGKRRFRLTLEEED